MAKHKANKNLTLYKIIKTWPSLLMGLFFLLPSCSLTSQDEKTYISSVVKVIDGDTFIDQKQNKIRILGIDTPEKYIKENGQFVETKGIRHYFSLLASEFTVQNLLSKKIKISIFKNDYYCRRIAKVILNHDEDFANKILLLGLARVFYISTNPKNHYFYPNYFYVKSLEASEKWAKIHHKGIWSQKPEVISEIFPNKNT